MANLPKAGDPADCRNYRGLLVADHASKLFTGLVETSVEEAARMRGLLKRAAARMAARAATHAGFDFWAAAGASRRRGSAVGRRGQAA